MAKWKSGYKAVAGVGIFDGVTFLPATIQPQWNLFTTQYSGINRVMALDAQYGEGYVGGVPASGVEISWEDVISISLDQNNPTTLFGVRMGKTPADPIVVVKAYRGNVYNWGIDVLTQVTATNITCHIFKRVYTDDTTYTDTFVTSGGCRAVQPDSGSASGSHTWLEFFEHENTFCFGVSNYFVTGNYIRSLWNLSYPEQSDFENVFGDDTPEPTNPTSDEFGPASIPAGGYNPEDGHGSFDDSSDIIGLDPKPSIGVTSAGFVNVYKVEQNQLATLGEKLFPHFLPAEILADPAQLSTPEVLTMMIKTLYGALISPVGTSVQLADNLGIIDVLMNGKLIDYVLDCHIIPTSISGSTVEGLRVGYRQFNDIQLAKATEDYVDVDCGSLSIPEYWGNFLDYGGCTVELFLPFVGFVPIDNEYWNGGTISVIYRVNIVDGSFQAKVFATSSKSQLTNSLIGQYGGVCCVHFPITGLQYSNVVAGLVNGSAGVVAKASGGDIAGAVTNAMNMAMLRPDAPSSNGYNASSGFLSHRTPYLVIKRPKAQFSQMYNKEMGLPLNVMFKLSSVHGFTRIDNPVLNIACSDSEYQEIVSLLKNGVILP